MIAYVFGYASLVALGEPLAGEGVEVAAQPGRLRGYRRNWGAAMDNWEAVNDHKHFVDPETGERPRLRVAYLDLYEREGASVNGLALPVDAERLATLDAREVNYERVEVSGAFEPALGEPVFAYLGSEAARERCRRGAEEGNVYVSSQYAALVRESFAALAPDALAEFDRTTDPSPFPERHLRRVVR